MAIGVINFPILLPLVWIQYLPPGAPGGLLSCQILRPNRTFWVPSKHFLLRNLGVKLGQLGKKQWVKSYELPYFVGLFHGYNIHSEHPLTSCWKISHQGCLHLRQRTIQQISCCGSAMSGMDFVYGEDRMGKAMGKAGDLEFNDF